MPSANLKNVRIKDPYWEISADLYFPPAFDEKKEISGHYQRSSHPANMNANHT
jgi:hypothetical protein